MEGQTVLDPATQVMGPGAESLEPAPKKQRVECGDTLPQPKIPSVSKLRWVLAKSELVPFAMNCETNTVHSGRSQMKLITLDDGSVVVDCTKGCMPDCAGSCCCPCHMLQHYYNTRSSGD